MNLLQLFIGMAGLSIGTLIYLTDRSPESTYLTWHILHGLTLHTHFPDLFGILDRSMASFLHSFSFTMISAGITAASRRGCLLVALFWGSVNTLFEVGQYFDTAVIKWIPDGFEGLFLLETLDDYFRAGTFDGYDLAAGIAGAGVGYWILVMTRKLGGDKDAEDARRKKQVENKKSVGS